MTKVDILRLDSVTNNDTTATATINTNFQRLQTAIENTLSRDGTTPNFMNANLDMNSYKLINGGEATDDKDYVTLEQMNTLVASTIPAAATAAESAANRAESSAQIASTAAAQASTTAATVDDAVTTAYKWATKTDGTVDGEEYSAKYYAQHSNIWAEGTDEEVQELGGSHSAKGWVTTIGSIYKPAGSIAFASLPTLGVAYEGYVYNVTDSFTTTSDFVEGAGKSYAAGTNVVCVDTGSSVYKWDVLGSFIDLSGYQPLLVSGTNIKTIDGNSILGSGNINLRNIGEIVASTIPLTDAGLHLLDGSLLSSGSYADFVDYIASLYNSGDYTAIFDTEANWQTAVTTYGVCGKFVYDSVNGTVRLPKINGFIEGTLDATKLGDLVQAGLPNITGTAGATYTGFENTSDCFTVNSSTRTVATGSSGSFPSLLLFDASLSNPIYGNSNTVQPQSIKILYYICIATTTKTQIEVDIDEVVTDLNGKADVDLTNVNSTGKTKVANWAMPSGTYDDLTLGASGTAYTAPANGYVWLSKVAGSNNKYVQIYSKISVQAHSTASDSQLSCFLPVKKGDKFSVSYNASGTTSYFRFVYAQGEN